MLALVFVATLVTGPGPESPVVQGGTVAQPPAAPAQAAPWPPPGVFKTGPDIKPPRILKDPKPKYTAAAMSAKVQGLVLMEAVIQSDGSVGEVRVTKSLDREHGLDDQAVQALKTWRFEPGTKDGVAVPVLVTVEMTFTLRR